MHKLAENTSAELVSNITEKLFSINHSLTSKIAWECSFIKATTAEQYKHTLRILEATDQLTLTSYSLDPTNKTIVTLSKEIQPIIQSLAESAKALIKATVDL